MPERFITLFAGAISANGESNSYFTRLHRSCHHFVYRFSDPRNGLIPETETIFSPAATDFNVNHMPTGRSAVDLVEM